MYNNEIIITDLEIIQTFRMPIYKCSNCCYTVFHNNNYCSNCGKKIANKEIYKTYEQKKVIFNYLTNKE